MDLRYLSKNISSLVFLPIWANIELNRNIRKFTSLVADSLEEVQWSFNDNWRDYFDNNVASTN
jgi:hypothetical protein